MIKRYLIPSLIAALLTLLLVAPCLAIGEPDSISIDDVYVYRNCRETGDQLYLVYYTIEYASLPDETVTEAYIVRLMDDEDDEIDHVYPYSYYNKGYGEGVAALYFDADDAPAWEGVCSMELIGNPFAEWEGDLPDVSVSSVDFTVWQDNELGITQVIVGGRIIDMAGDLEDDWGKDMVTLSDDGKQVLTTYAAGYFVNVVPNLYEISPDIFAVGQGGATEIYEPDIPPEVERTDYSDELVTNIIDTPFDLTDTADAFGVSRGALSALLYYGIVALAMILIARQIQTYKPMMLLSIPFVILGAFIGVPLIATILAGLVALGATAYIIFYKPSTA